MVLVPLKKTLTFYFARVCQYCSLRSLMYCMTTLAPSIIFPVDGFGFLLGFGFQTSKTTESLDLHLQRNT